MIVCSNCSHSNMTGTLFCIECGTPLGVGENLITQNMRKSRGMKPENKGPAKLEPPPTTFNSWVTLHLLDTGQVLPLAERDEFTLGRISEGQSIMPDIDLSPYQAYASGVSRLHALIKLKASRVFLTDLGSANGTYINGKRLNQNIEYSLTNGDVVALGKLKIQMLLRVG